MRVREKNDSQRVEHGLCLLEMYDAAFSADVDGAENIRTIKRNSETATASVGIGVLAGWHSL